MNPYKKYVARYERILKQGASIPLGGIPAARKPKIKAKAPKALLFSPHPDDECITGGLPLRLLRELKINVINVAVTQGSHQERQSARLEELKNACNYLGFGLLQTGEHGLEKVNLKTRDQDPQTWKASMGAISKLLQEHRPAIVFVPHEQDWNSSHVGTHHLVLDALKQLDASFTCLVVETEFWGQMSTPNLMVESSVKDVADLVAALSFHVGEVKRNPYHLRLPAWMQDNVRLGGELVGGQGGSVPDYSFATLYRVWRWAQGQLVKIYEGGRQVSVGDDLKTVFALT
ncbi:MAG: PIG-L family deacetylase [Lentisphaerota bacterium]